MQWWFCWSEEAFVQHFAVKADVRAGDVVQFRSVCVSMISHREFSWCRQASVDANVELFDWHFFRCGGWVFFSFSCSRLISAADVTLQECLFIIRLRGSGCLAVSPKCTVHIWSVGKVNRYDMASEEMFAAGRISEFFFRPCNIFSYIFHFSILRPCGDLSQSCANVLHISSWRLLEVSCGLPTRASVELKPGYFQRPFHAHVIYE